MHAQPLHPTLDPRAAIVLEDGTRLAVPPMRHDLPSSVRVRVFEYVLRRQYGLAWDVAQIEADVIEGRVRDMELAGRPAYTSAVAA